MKRPMICLVLVVAFVLAVAPPVEGQSTIEEAMQAMMDATNAELAAAGADYRLVMVEYLTNGCDEGANTVVARDLGNQRAEFDFVPFDDRRLNPIGVPGWGDPNGGITYVIDTTSDAVPLAGGLDGAMTDAAIDRAMNSWDAIGCSFLPLVRKFAPGVDIGVEAFIFTGGADGSPNIVADVQHAGFRDLDFDPGIVSATFTFGFCQPCTPNLVYTDVDSNGRFDTAFREIYYDWFAQEADPPGFRVWSDDGVSDFDVESVALHEAGHGLSQEHFGQVFVDSESQCQFAPRAVMNSVYDGPLRTLQGTDVGGHCANWGNWPLN